VGANFSDSTPSAPTGRVNVHFQSDTGGNISANVPDFTADFTAKEDVANKGIADGYAPLDSSGKVPSANLPTGSTITLKTDGTNNGSQSVLNLVAGAGVTITDNGSGTITFTAASITVNGA
jgi:hypothetical protein